MKKLRNSSIFRVFLLFLSLVFLVLIYFKLVPWINQETYLLDENISFGDRYNYDPSRNIKIFIELFDADISKKQIEMNNLIEPGPLGTQGGNSFSAKNNFEIWIDSADGFSRNTFYSGYSYSRINTKAFLTPERSVKYYPFDLYASEIGYFGNTIENNNVEVPISLQFQSQAQTNPRTFQTSIYRLPYSTNASYLSPEYFDAIQKDIKSGYALIRIDLQRDNITRLLTLLLGLIIFGLTVIGFSVTLKIQSGKRPPSLTSLIWVNALVFTIILSRNSLPGNPPVGIIFDLVILFPSVLILSIFNLILMKLWLTREDHIYQ